MNSVTIIHVILCTTTVLSLLYAALLTHVSVISYREIDWNGAIGPTLTSNVFAGFDKMGHL